MQTHLIIALPNRLLATALAEYVVAKGKDMTVCGIATDSKQIFELLEHCPATALLYDPYLPGPGPEVICCRLRQEFSNLKIMLMKNVNANGRFNEAEKCSPSAIIGSDAEPQQFLEMLLLMGKKKMKMPKTKAVKIKNSKDKPLLSQREQEMVNLIARGHSAREIAFVLDIAVNTARNHTQNILKKLKLSKKIQLITWNLSN
jgi:DNA-binding NarL/FixJ family response regulator